MQFLVALFKNKKYKHSGQRRITCCGLASAICAPSALLSGCTREPAIKRPPIVYQESVEGILFSPSAKKIIVVGERYHYLFDDQNSLEKVLAASFRESLGGTFGTFQVGSDNRISGAYTIRTRQPLRPTEKAEAQRLGFRELPDGQYELAATIVGLRYTAVPLTTATHLPKLSQPYAIAVQATFDDRSQLRPSREVHQAADAVLTILLAPLIIITFLFLSPCITCK